jgi:hypothetical protein
VFLLAFIFLAAQDALAQVTRTLFTPPVVPENYTQPVRFEATVTGSPASVVFEYNLVDRPMFDNGTNGDQVANDGVWTILFQPGEILSKLTPGSVFRPFIGYCKVGASRFNVFAEVWTSTVSLPAIRQLDSTMQSTDYVTNFVVPPSEVQAPNLASIANRFYATYPDVFDFLNIVSIGSSGNRHHVTVRNPVAGIGSPIFDSSSTYGSNGRLMGVNVFPLPGFFDGAGTGFNHETGHQWINFLNRAPFASGIPHWPTGSLAINVMGFSIGGTGGQGGNFSWAFTPNGQGGYFVSFNQAPNQNTTMFNSMELYLMGLASPDEVGSFFVLNNQSQQLVSGQVLQPSEITTVGVNDVIAAFGPRVPTSNDAPRNFRVATIILSAQLLDGYSLSLYDWFARRAEATQPLPCSEGFSQHTCRPFYLATGGRGTMNAKLGTPNSLETPDSQGTPDFNVARLLGDFNGDGRSDILWQHADGSAGMWLMNGLSMIGGSGFLGAGTGWTARLIGDFNGDAKSDILWQHADGTTALWLMNGLSLSSGGLLLGAGTGWTARLIGDFNGDGKSDIVWQHADGTSALWLMNGLSLSSGGLLLGAGTGWSPKLLADFDGDAKSDIVWQHANGSSALWLMNGLSMIGGGGLLGAGTGWNAKLLGDLNGDGKSDILWQHADGTSALWLMNGLSLSSGGVLLGAGTGWSPKLLADFDGDAKSDIVWQHADGSAAMWLMNGLTLSSAGGLLGPSTGWSADWIGEFNGDAESDILWQHADGSISAWLMNGMTLGSSGTILGPGTGWLPVP